MAQYFNLTLDTTAPSSGVLSGLDSYYNSSASVNIAASNASFMKVWTNQTATGTTSDSTYPTSWEPYATSKTVSFSGQGTQYVHAQFMDEVGNISGIVDSAATIYDTVAPNVTSVSVNSGDGYTTQAACTVRVSFSDATAGVDSITLSGDIATAEAVSYTLTAADRTAGYKDFNVTLQGADGTKTVSATATDFAGNTSAAGSDTIVLDTTAAVITPVLRLSNDSANLPSYVNFNGYGVRINTDATDIVNYKIWEGDTEPSTWTDISNATVVANVGYFVGSQNLSNGDGLKTIHVKVQDVAGNVTEGSALTVTLDTTAPVVTLSSDVSVISAVSGFDTVTFACGATDTNSAQGLSYELKLGDDVIKSGIFASSVAVTQAEIEAISAGEGNKSFTLEVTDVAENTGISTAVVVTLDKTAPTGSVSADTYYSNSSFNVTIGGTDTGGAGMSQMKVYLDNAANADWETYVSGAYALSNVADGAHTAHVQFKDAVGNVSSVYDSTEFIVDTHAPTGSISTVSYTNSRTITVSVDASDTNGAVAVSGVGYMKVWENGQTEPVEWSAYALSTSITLAEGADGNRTVNAKFKDNAGNVSASVATCTTFYDHDVPDATLNLLTTSGSGLNARVNIRNFQVRISHSDVADTDEASPIVEYKLSGNFDQSNADWQTFEYDENQNYMTISGLTLTDSDGLKTITVQLKDAAGNVSSAVNATVTLDRQPPEIDVKAPDYNVISKQHTLRLNSSGTTISGKYNDVIIFTWSANEALNAYKVCVNAVNQEAESASAIGTTNGSLNMSGGPIEANYEVTSTIFGADFAATDAVNDTDGVYEIIVYGQDEGGTWSAIHALEEDPGSNPNPSPKQFVTKDGNNFTLSNGDNFVVQGE